MRERDTQKPFYWVGHASLHTSVERTSGCDIKGSGSISICNVGNLLHVFKLLATELLKRAVFLKCLWQLVTFPFKDEVIRIKPL